MTSTRPKPQRGEQGHAAGSFLRKMTMVCLIALVISGLVVYWIGETAPAPRDGHKSAAGHPPHRTGHKPSADDTTPAMQQSPPRTGGVGCGGRA